MVLERWVWMGGLVLGLGVGGCSDDDGGGAEEPADLPGQVRAAVEGSLGKGFATAYSIAVWKDGAVVYAEAFGSKDEAGSPATTETLFQIGSDTKKITALALLREVEAGNVALDQTVAELLPDLVLASDPTYLDTVTVRDLLRQTTGLYDYAPFSDAPDDGDLEGIAYGRFSENEHTLMPSGIAYRYSNPNYALAGLLTEVSAGRPWADVVAEDVLGPLGLSRTYARVRDVLAAETDVASGYGSVTFWDFFDPLEPPELELGWLDPEEQPDNAFVRPAGLVWSTATDQARLLGFFIEGNPSVLSDELRLAMMTEQVTLYNHSAGLGYGYGFISQSFYPSTSGTFHEIPVLAHDGGTLNMTSFSLLLPEQRVAVSVLANGMQEDLSLVAAVALEAAVGEPLPARTGRPSVLGQPSDDLAAYAGSFTDPILGEITLTWDGRRLEVESAMLDELGVNVGPLEPVGNDLFLVDVDGEPTALSFYDGADGEPRHYGVNRAFVLTRAR